MIVQPHYDRVACLFNWPHAVHGDEVYVVKVDCGIEVIFSLDLPEKSCLGLWSNLLLVMLMCSSSVSFVGFWLLQKLTSVCKLLSIVFS